MSIANGFVPATFSIKCGPSFADDQPTEKRFLPDSSQTGSSSTVADEFYEASFNRAEFVQDQSISAAAPAILSPMLFQPKYFLPYIYALRQLPFYCQPYDGPAFSSGQEMGSSGQQMGNIVVVRR
jgi:hypothetical protein